MRWKTKERPEWKWKFLLLPLAIGGTTHWLEWVQWRHKVIDIGTWAGGGHGETFYRDAGGKNLGKLTEHYG